MISPPSTRVNTRPAGTFTGSKKSRCCPVCNRTKDGDCRISDNGRLVLCHSYVGGIGSPTAGWTYTGDAKAGILQRGVFVLDDDHYAPHAHIPDKVANRFQAPPPVAVDPIKLQEQADKEAWVKKWKQTLYDNRRDFSSIASETWTKTLGLSLESAEALGVKQSGPWFAYSERNGDGDEIALGIRHILTGEKKTLGLKEAGPRYGLTYSQENFQSPAHAAEIVYAVEGPTDTAAMLDMGETLTIGRFNNMLGGSMIAVLLARLGYLPGGSRAATWIRVIGDNDQKPDVTWPGRDGAEKTAGELMAAGFHNVRIVYPPADFKDVRAFLIDRKAKGLTAAQAGEELRAHFACTAKPFEGPLPVPGAAAPAPTAFEYERNAFDELPLAIRDKIMSPTYEPWKPCPDCPDPFLDDDDWMTSRGTSERRAPGVCPVSRGLNRKSNGNLVYTGLPCKVRSCDRCREMGIRGIYASFKYNTHGLDEMHVFRGSKTDEHAIAQRITTRGGKYRCVLGSLGTVTFFADVAFPGSASIPWAEALDKFRESLYQAPRTKGAVIEHGSHEWKRLEEKTGKFTIDELDPFIVSGKLTKEFFEDCGLKGFSWPRERLPAGFKFAKEYPLTASQRWWLLFWLEAGDGPGDCSGHIPAINVVLGPDGSSIILYDPTHSNTEENAFVGSSP